MRHNPHCVCDRCVKEWRAYIKRRDRDLARIAKVKQDAKSESR